MGKGGGGAHTPVEAKETSLSKQLVKFVEILSDGEVAGLANGMKSVYLDNTPVQNSNNSYNFKNFSLQGRVGSQVQGVLGGFNTSEKEVSVGAQVKNNLPITRTITDSKVSRLRFTIGVQSLSNIEENGDIKETEVNLAITIGGTVYPVTIFGKYSSQYLQQHTFKNLPPAPFTIKVERLTADSNSQRLQNNTVWSSYTEVIDTEFTYPNTALIGVKFDSEYFGNIPNRTYDLLGIKVKIPSNYNPKTRQYSGVWDGTFKIDWTDNPAWVLFDIVTNKRYGLGNRLGEFGADKWTLYQVAQYCDQLVPDGFGGREPRFTCNAWLTEQRSAYDVINDICSIFRAMPVWNGQQLTVVMDRPADPVWTYTNANVENGEFNYTFSAKKARHNAIQVEYADKDNSYERAIEYVSDDESIRKNGLNVKKITAFGCTSRGQAHRTGLWLLQTEKLETKTVTFTVGAEGLMHVPGDIIKVADTYYAGTNIGGRVLAINGKKVTLDREISVNGNSYFSYINQNAKHQDIKIISVKGSEVTLDQAPTGLEAYGVWSLSTQQVTSQLFKALSVKEDAKGKYTITALQHEPQKEAIVDNGAKFEPKSTSILNAPQISNIGVITNPDGSVSFATDITGGNGLVKYDIKIYKDGALYDVRLGQSSPNISFDDLENGEYTVVIQIKNEKGQLLGERTQTFTIDKPPAPTGVIVTGGLGNITIEWDWIDEATSTEIFVSETDDIKTAKRLAKVNSRTYTHEVGAKQVRYYWLRHTRGVNIGPFNQRTGIRGESSVDIDAELEILNKKLSQNIADEVIDTALPARKLELTKTVSELNTSKFIGHNQVYNTMDGKLYVWNGREYTTKVQASDLSGKVNKSQLDNALIGEINSAKSTADTANSVAQQAKSETASLSAQIQSEANARGTAITQLQNVDKQQAQQITALTAKAESALSGLEAEKTARANGDKAEAKVRETLTAKVNNAESAINEIKSTKASKNEVASLAQSSLQAIWKNDAKAELDKLQVGGRNLIIDSGTPITSSDYGQRYKITEAPAVGDDVVVTLYGEVGADRTGIGVFNSRGYGELLTLEKVADGVYQGKGKWKLANGGQNEGIYADNTHLNLYFYPSSANSNYTINKVKFERGTVATDWTPAPEDAESSIANVSAELTNHQKVTAEKDKSQAQQITALSSSVASAKAEVQSVSRTVADVNGKLSATHTIKTQAISGGKTAIAGISLGANREESSVIVMADKFQVVPNSNGTPKPIFKVQNGKAVVAGDLIADGEVTASKLAANSVTTGALQAGAIRAEHIATTQITGEKLALGLGGNLLKNPLFTGNSEGWHGFVFHNEEIRKYWTAGSVGVQYENLRYNTNQNYRPRDSRYKDETFSLARWTVNGFSQLATDSKNNQLWVDNARVFANVIAGKTYIFSAYVGCHHCGGYLIAEEYSADSKNYVRWIAGSGLFGERDRILLNDGEACAEASSSHFANGLNTSGAHRAFVKFTAPSSGVVCLIFRIARFGNKQAYQDCYMARAMLEEVNPNQNAPSPWRETSITSIDGGSIVTNSITTKQLGADSVTANNIAAGAIAAKHIAANSINSNHIVTRSLTSDKLNVDSLSAISSNIGRITAGDITGTNIHGNTISGGEIRGSNINGGTIRGVIIEGSTIRGVNIEGQTIKADNIIGDIAKFYSVSAYRSDNRYDWDNTHLTIDLPAAPFWRKALLYPTVLPFGVYSSNNEGDGDRFSGVHIRMYLNDQRRAFNYTNTTPEKSNWNEQFIMLTTMMDLEPNRAHRIRIRLRASDRHININGTTFTFMVARS
jgi:phage tail protein/putative fels-1 prophage host specificity protein|uniref:Tail protein n=1 Tax=Myoviridae sp. ctpKu3 TaxID=2825175 RepID=A0A8S5UVQ0_9CAUD|nr:MAG TPA: tail protein [Myoviridae sp. ctpKu3]